MYQDAIFRWNICVGCLFDCVYCKKSFQAQMKRQKPVIDKRGRRRGCQNCYDYFPHIHPDRLTKKFTSKNFPVTKGDQFIWCCSSSDIFFTQKEWMESILSVARDYNDRTFFFQTKAPSVFNKYEFPSNTYLGITLESNRDYRDLSKAPLPTQRAEEFAEVNHPYKIVTIEPILAFDLYQFVLMIKEINPRRVYIGYDTKKSWWMEGNRKVYLKEFEPTLAATNKLIQLLRKFTVVKIKYIPEPSKSF